MSALKDELANDPLAKGYAGMSDQEAADSLNALTEQRARSIIPTHEIDGALDPTEEAALTSDKQSQLSRILSMGTVDIQSSNTRTKMGAMFGGGSTSRANLIALQNELVSRVSILGLGPVRAGHIANARA